MPFYGSFEPDRCFPDDEDDDSGEDFGVRSSCKGPLDTMSALQEGLPAKRGISKYYSGKSKSFTSLADAYYASSAQDLAKPENPYCKKRKNLLARGTWDDKNRASPSNNNAICTSEKPSISHQTALNQGYPINYSKSSRIMEESQSRSSSPSSSRPPLHPCPKPSYVSGSCSSPPRMNSPWRSLSLCDLQSVAGNCND
ncbi:Protein OXIDATIVE STRESS 3 LIKE 1 [Euphorbia peplus]|nr:Protein OXIDATIVE STRESS 3 LIKE 1 [Euphorbia peplus]